MISFEPLAVKGIKFRNHILRSATYEGRCDAGGFPTDDYYHFYETLARNEVGGVITGFAFISKEGRSMQPAQAGIDSPDKIPGFRKLTELMHRYSCPVILQVAHSGRQTLPGITGLTVRGASKKRSFYFKSRPVPYSTAELSEVINQFGMSAEWARKAGFDGIQIHAAHGYLIHQFLLRSINNRDDEFGIDPETGIGTLFLEKIVNAIRERCGEDFPVFVKISGGINDEKIFGKDQFIALIRALDRLRVDAIEISYGTMDFPFNIFRGDVPVKMILDHNPIYGAKGFVSKTLNRAMINKWYKPRMLPYTATYNLHFAKLARQITRIPIISVGGFRNLPDIETAMTTGDTDMVSLCRPLIAEPDFITQIRKEPSRQSRCTGCNKCAVMCDSGRPTQCYTVQNK